MSLYSHCGSGELHVGASTAQPCVPIGTNSKTKSQRRRTRMKKCAILRSKADSHELMSQLGRRDDAGDAPVAQWFPRVALESRLETIERKLDSLVLAFIPNGFPYACSGNVPQAYTTVPEYIPSATSACGVPVPNYGVSSESLSMQCSAARTLQSWWKRFVQKQCQKSHEVLPSLVAEEVAGIDTCGSGLMAASAAASVSGVEDSHEQDVFARLTVGIQGLYPCNREWHKTVAVKMAQASAENWSLDFVHEFWKERITIGNEECDDNFALVDLASVFLRVEHETLERELAPEYVPELPAELWPLMLKGTRSGFLALAATLDAMSYERIQEYLRENVQHAQRVCALDPDAYASEVDRWTEEERSGAYKLSYAIALWNHRTKQSMEVT